MSNRNRKLPPVHPGEILREDLMEPLDLNVATLARDLKIPVSSEEEYIAGAVALLGQFMGAPARAVDNSREREDQGAEAVIALRSGMGGRHSRVKSNARQTDAPLPTLGPGSAGEDIGLLPAAPRGHLTSIASSPACDADGGACERP